MSGRKQIVAVAVASLLVGALCAPAAAQRSEAKRALILELLGLSGADEMAEQMRLLILSDLKAGYPTVVDSAMSRQKGLSEKDEARLREKLSDFNTFEEQFNERFEEHMKFATLVPSVYEPLYDRYFTEEELDEMVGFYRTTVGQKAIATMPMLMQEAAQSSFRAMQPRVASLIEAIFDEERAKLD